MLLSTHDCQHDAGYWRDTVAITKLTVENFKSFDKLEVELRPFNIIVGTNASGKSNFLDVFRFLRDIEASTLESAIGIRGGGETLRNFNLDGSQVLRILVETDDIQKRLVNIQSDRAFGMERSRITYELSIRLDESEEGFQVVTDRLTEHFTIIELSEVGLDRSDGHFWVPSASSQPTLESGHYVERQRIGQGRTLYQREHDLITCRFELPECIPFTEADFSINHGYSMDLQGSPHVVMLERLPRLVLLI